MSSTSETGHTINLDHYNTLIVKCTGFGATYNPGNTRLTVANMTTQYTAGFNAHKALNTALEDSKEPINERQILFDPLDDVVTRALASLDSLDDATFKRMNDVDFPVSDVLDGIEAAHRVGLGPVKVNMVVKRGLNDQDIVPMARYFKDAGHILRFIEFMDVGHTNGWRMDDVVTAAQIVERIDEIGRAHV